MSSMRIPDCYDPVYQAERREYDADNDALICENCMAPIRGEYYWDIAGEPLCERCAIRMYRRNVEALNYGY